MNVIVVVAEKVLEYKVKMSKAQYNLNTKTDYLNRKMFLDPAGPVTIQRFEEVKYKRLQILKQLHVVSFGCQKRLA